MNFPLGDKLFQVAASLGSGTIDLEKLLAQFENTTQEQRNHLGILLIHYYYASGGTGDPFRSHKKSDLPYEIKTNPTGKGCSVNPKTVPPILLNSFIGYLGL